jgi:hypothetical protein
MVLVTLRFESGGTGSHQVLARIREGVRHRSTAVRDRNGENISRHNNGEVVHRRQSIDAHIAESDGTRDLGVRASRVDIIKPHLIRTVIHHQIVKSDA